MAVGVGVILSRWLVSIKTAEPYLRDQPDVLRDMMKSFYLAYKVAGRPRFPLDVPFDPDEPAKDMTDYYIGGVEEEWPSVTVQYDQSLDEPERDGFIPADAIWNGDEPTYSIYSGNYRLVSGHVPDVAGCWSWSGGRTDFRFWPQGRIGLYRRDGVEQWRLFRPQDGRLVCDDPLGEELADYVLNPHSGDIKPLDEETE